MRVNIDVNYYILHASKIVLYKCYVKNEHTGQIKATLNKQCSIYCPIMYLNI